MKKVLLSLFLIGTTLAAFCQKTETRAVSEFTGINASSVFEITVTKGTTESLTIEADDNIMPYVKSEVKKGVLHLFIDKDKVEKIKILKATVVMKNLDQVKLSGACKLTANDLFTPEQFDGGCSGASAMTLNLKTGQLSIGASGACAINLKAEVTKNADLDMSGSSKMQIELNAAKVIFNSSGSSKVELKGSATEIEADMSGAINIDAVDFTVKTATIKSSGSSSVKFHVTDLLKINASGASSIKYKGSPKLETNTSGASSIKQL